MPFAVIFCATLFSVAHLGSLICSCLWTHLRTQILYKPVVGRTFQSGSAVNLYSLLCVDTIWVNLNAMCRGLLLSYSRMFYYSQQPFSYLIWQKNPAPGNNVTKRRLYKNIVIIYLIEIKINVKVPI